MQFVDWCIMSVKGMPTRPYTTGINRAFIHNGFMDRIGKMVQMDESLISGNGGSS